MRKITLILLSCILVAFTDSYNIQDIPLPNYDKETVQIFEANNNIHLFTSTSHYGFNRSELIKLSSIPEKARSQDKSSQEASIYSTDIEKYPFIVGNGVVPLDSYMYDKKFKGTTLKGILHTNNNKLDITSQSKKNGIWLKVLFKDASVFLLDSSNSWKEIKIPIQEGLAFINNEGEVNSWGTADKIVEKIYDKVALNVYPLDANGNDWCFKQHGKKKAYQFRDDTFSETPKNDVPAFTFIINEQLWMWSFDGTLTNTSSAQTKRYENFPLKSCLMYWHPYNSFTAWEDTSGNVWFVKAHAFKSEVIKLSSNGSITRINIADDLKLKKVPSLNVGLENDTTIKITGGGMTMSKQIAFRHTLNLKDNSLKTDFLGSESAIKPVRMQVGQISDEIDLIICRGNKRVLLWPVNGEKKLISKDNAPLNLIDNKLFLKGAKYIDFTSLVAQ